MDRFHVAKHAIQAAATVRRQTMQDLKQGLSPTEYKALKGVHLVFRRHRDALSQEQHALLERLFGYAPTLRLVYDFREGSFAVFEKQPSVAQATQDLKAWMLLVREQHSWV